MEPMRIPTSEPDERLIILACVAVTLFVAFWFIRGVRRLLFGGHRAGGGWRGSVLDSVLMWWTKRDAFTLRDLLNGGLVIMGRPGSGKSSSSFFAILHACVKCLRSGGLILAASPSDRPMVEFIFSWCRDRLVIFDERSTHRFNVFDYILACGGSTKDLLAAIYAIVETIGRTGQNGGVGGEDGSFFSQSARRLIEYAIVVLKHVPGSLTPSKMIEFINGAASSLAEMHSEEFAATFHYQCLKTAHEKEKSQVESYDVEQARAFFTREWLLYADRTRTSILAVAMTVLHAFATGNNRLLFSTDTTITPRVMDIGKWVFVDMPISRCGQEGAFALGVWKFVTEWHVLRRDSGRDNPPLIIAVDEFHNSINSEDTHFLGEGRKFSGCMLACTQSKASFYANMGGEAAEAQVDALLNNFSHKIFHALGDIRTAEWASELCGSAMQFNLGGSEQQTGERGLLNAWMGDRSWGGSVSETMRPLVEPRAFMHGLRTGGPINGNVCDALLLRSGEPFSNGQNFLWLAFKQPEMR